MALELEPIGELELEPVEVLELEPVELEIEPVEEPGAVAGLGGALKRGGISVLELPAVAAAVGTAGRKGATIGQERRAFVEAMEDPRYMGGLMTGDEKADGLYGPGRRQAGMEAQGRAVREIWSGVVAEFEAEKEGVPRTKAEKELGQAKGSSEKWKVWRKYPVQLTASIVAESLPASVAGALGGTVLGGPGAGTAAGAGLASFATTAANELLSEAARKGYDVSDGESLSKFVESEEDWGAALEMAVTKGGVVGGVDALTAGMAGRFIGPALREGLRKAAVASGKEVVLQAGGGAAGELAGQAVSGQAARGVDWFDVGMEGLAEIASGGPEVAGNLRGAGKGKISREGIEEPTLGGTGAPVESVPTTIEEPIMAPARTPALPTAEEFLEAEGEVQSAVEQLQIEEEAAPVQTSGPEPEAWEVSGDEYAGRSEVPSTQISLRKEHERAVRQAVAEGKAVPAEVAAEYGLGASALPQAEEILGPAEEPDADVESDGGAGKQLEPGPITSELPSESKLVAGGKKRRIRLAERADGVWDVLDGIKELGGIAAPNQSKFATKGEYDGYAEAFGYGVARVLRRTAGGLRPDELRDSLANYGFQFETLDEMYEAVARAAAEREALKKAARRGSAEPSPEEIAAAEEAVMAMQVPGGLKESAIESESDVRIREAKRRVRAAWDDMMTLGIVADPKRDAEKAFRFYKELFGLAREYIAKGVKTLEEFAAKIGGQANGLLKMAWDDAVAGRPKTNALQLEPKVVNEVMDGGRRRNFSERFAADERIAPELRAATGNERYIPMPNVLTVAQALAEVDRLGLERAAVEVRNEQNGWNERVRVAIGEAVIVRLNHAYEQVKERNPAEAERLQDEVVTVAEWLTEYGTRLGQGVQAFAIWARMSPDGYVRAYKRAVKGARDRRLERAGVPAGSEVTPEMERKLKLPKVDKEEAKRIRAKAAEALKKPEGFQRDEALIDVLATIARTKGLNGWDIGMGLWYANILSGWTTQTRNGASSLAHVLMEAGTHVAVRPWRLGDVLVGLYQGAIRGALDAANVLRTGKVTGTRLQRVEKPRVLEMVKFRGPLKVLNAWKYVFRVMAATDMVFFRSAEEMRAHFLARDLARKEGLTGKDLTRRMAEILHETPAVREAAKAQAASEGLTGLALRRRVAEVMEQGRPKELVQAAAEYGRFASFNQEPEGVLGVLARLAVKGGREFAPLRLVVPFATIIANATNASLNYTPWGYRRLFKGVFVKGMEFNAPIEYQLQAARATLGTIGLMAVWSLLQGELDDEDPEFMITATGPQDPRHQQQLRETGWRPYTVKIGSRYYSYQWSPLVIGLSYLGGMADAYRYKKLSERDVWQRAAYGIAQIGPSLMNQSFITGLSEFLDDLTDDRVAKTGLPFRWARRMAGTVVPNIVKQIDRLFDPSVYDPKTLQSALMQDIPVARSSLDVRINALGEPIRADQNPFVSVERPDALWQTLASKQAWVSTPAKTTMIEDRMITPEEYYQYVYVSGRAIRRRLDPMVGTLQRIPAEDAQDRVDQVVREERAKAKRQLFGR